MTHTPPSIRKKRIGIFGGSFDPPHKAHLAIARRALEEFSLDKVYFVPAFCPPHAIPKKLSEPAIRLEMLRRLLSGEKKFAIDSFELKKRKKIYTFQTIQRYKKRYPSCEIYFILGSDSFKELPRWKKGMDLLDMCRFIVAPRRGFSISWHRALSDARRQSKDSQVFLLDMTPVGISSSEIRAALWDNFSKNKVADIIIEDMVPHSVMAVIRKNFLYLDEAVRKYLEKNLDSAKYRHTLSVAKVSQELGVILGADGRKAYLAGLIHDLGRCVKVRDYIRIALENKLVPRTEISLYRKNPFLLHSHISAYLAQKIFAINDREILDAAKRHTIMTTKDKAGVYDKIVYVSDAVSGDRRYPGVEKIRNVALRGDIDKAVFLTSAMKLSYVIKKRKYLAPDGIKVYNSFLP